MSEKTNRLWFGLLLLCCAALTVRAQIPDAPVDMNADGKTDYVVVRNTGGGAGGQITWFVQLNGGANSGSAWGVAGDFFVPEDYDGDDKDDIAVWRPGALGFFYVLNSSNNTFQSAQFGQTGDDATVVRDYDGDNKADFAVYRGGLNSGNPSFWFYRPSNSPGVNFTTLQWGQNGDFPAPGDYDGDLKGDFVVQRGNSIGKGTFLMLKSGGGFEGIEWGLSSDRVVPGDYDADGKTDVAVARSIAGDIRWFVLERDGGTQFTTWGASATDFVTQGDYNGDGKCDFAVWRGATGIFYIRPAQTSGAQDIYFKWGQSGDYPVANYNVH